MTPEELGAVMLLEALEQHARDRGPAAPCHHEPAPVVGGTLWDIDADDVRTYMAEVDRQVRELDESVSWAIQHPDQAKLGIEFSAPEWNTFVWGAGGGAEGAERTYAPGKSGWAPFYAANYSTIFGPPMWNTLELWQQTEAYERRLLALYDSFVGSGGKTALERPEPGPTNPPDQSALTGLRDVFMVGAVVAGIVAVGYALSSAAKLRGAA